MLVAATLLGEFGDIGVTATANFDGTVSLAFVAMDPAIGAPRPIGTMTNAGRSGGGAKYSFQGTVAGPVKSVLLRSSLNGTATAAVAQK